ncbi:hypothetical protein BDN72DRAFT_858701 [Pluteus cervinus]|uniref:Uncharacterized protein n=1 Tax=Pluteus cervinus TaxID=181527 RepID=A0ACD3AQE0_9AGAR|nr:hypothetical protein BDN72DRAFT_858701 [Pluteus cervinus]
MNNQYDYESSADHHQSISELPEYDVAPLNLGVEDPEDMATPVLGSEDSSGTVNTNVVAKRRSWSPKRWDNRALKGTKEVVDMDCGICFENAVMPCQTRCCGRLFCLEHIADVIYDRESLLAPKEWGPIIGKVLSFVGLMLVYYALFS